MNVCIPFFIYTFVTLSCLSVGLALPLLSPICLLNHTSRLLQAQVDAAHEAFVALKLRTAQEAVCQRTGRPIPLAQVKEVMIDTAVTDREIKNLSGRQREKRMRRWGDWIPF